MERNKTIGKGLKVHERVGLNSIWSIWISCCFLLQLSHNSDLCSDLLEEWLGGFCSASLSLLPFTSMSEEVKGWRWKLFACSSLRWFWLECVQRIERGGSGGYSITVGQRLILLAGNTTCLTWWGRRPTTRQTVTRYMWNNYSLVSVPVVTANPAVVTGRSLWSGPNCVTLSENKRPLCLREPRWLLPFFSGLSNLSFSILTCKNIMNLCNQPDVGGCCLVR